MEHVPTVFIPRSRHGAAPCTLPSLLGYGSGAPMPRGSSPVPRGRAQAPRHAGCGPAVLQKPSRPRPFCSLSASDDGTLQEQQPRGRQVSQCNAALRTTTSRASGGCAHRWQSLHPFHLDKHRAAEQIHCHQDCYLESAEKQAAGSQDNKTDARDMIQPR